MLLSIASSKRTYGVTEEVLPFLLRFRLFRLDGVELLSKEYLESLVQWLDQHGKPLEQVPVHEFSKTDAAQEIATSAPGNYRAAFSQHVIYSPQEAAKLLGVQPGTIIKWVNQGGLSANYTQAGQMMTPRTELENLGEWVSHLYR